MACVDLPALPLQLLLHRQPEWRRRPVAVVENDSPLSPLLWVNEAARRVGILPGMRYAAGLSLDRHLCAGTVPASEIAGIVEQLQRELLRFSPEVEPATDEPGVFWLNAGGLDRLHDSLESWAEQIITQLRDRHFAANITVGFTRFGTYTLVRVRRGIHVLPSAAAETRTSRAVPLARMGITPRLRDDLERLGVRTVGEFLALPAAGIQKRFGVAAERLHRLARGDLFDPLRPVVPPEPDRVRHFLDDPESDAWRLLFLIKRLTHPLLARLADRQQGVERFHLYLVLADHGRRHEMLQPAAPTLDMVLLMELVRLRLENLALDSGVEILTIEVDATAAPPETLNLFRESLRRDPRAGLRALARIRAEFGDESVVHAVLSPGHLPEAGFRWAPVQELKNPDPVPTQHRPLVRRLLARPVPLATALADLLHEKAPGLLVGRPPSDNSCRQLLRRSDRRDVFGDRPVGPSQHRLQALRMRQPQARQLDLCGSYSLSGGWWRREVRRCYYFVETDRDELLWVYYDQYRRRWFMQGTVE